MNFGDSLILHAIDQALLAVMIVVIMFGMGAGLTLADFKAVFRRRRLVAIGFISQFGFMPLLAFGLAHALSLEPYLAIALILIGTLPGGSTSNMFTYFARGNVALSISMTTASTLAALVMIPLLLNLYTPQFVKQISSGLENGPEFVIPTANILVSLMLVLVPVAAGMILRQRSRGWAKAAEDTAGFTAMIVILFLIFTTVVRHHGLVATTPARVYLAAITLGLFGFGFGYLASYVWGAPPMDQRAISLETGIQNGPVAFAILLLTFPDPAVVNPMLWMTILYSTFIVCSSSIVTLYLRKCGRFDAEVAKNTVVHRRLFGSEYTTRYPDGFLPQRICHDPAQGTFEES